MTSIKPKVPNLTSLIVFFGMAFGLSWASWIPLAMDSRGQLDFAFDPTLLALVGAFGPFLAAFITAALLEGKHGVGMLLRGFQIWRVGWRWYSFALLWPLALSLATSGVHVLLGGAPPDLARPPFFDLYPLPQEARALGPWAFLPLVFAQNVFLGSAMGEEPGWRGYALPRLQARFGALRASVILGLLWALWHLPLNFVQGDPREGFFDVWLVLGLVATAILFTWICDHARGSLLPALLFHASIAVTGLFLTPSPAHPAIEVALTWAAAIAVSTWSGGHRAHRDPVAV